MDCIIIEEREFRSNLIWRGVTYEEKERKQKESGREEERIVGDNVNEITEGLLNEKRTRRRV